MKVTLHGGLLSSALCSFLPVYLPPSFAKLREMTVSFAISVRLSVRTGQLGSHWTDFREILILDDFAKICQENSS